MKLLITKQDRLQNREAIIPKGALKVVPKGLDVVFYLYTTNKGPSVACFRGTAGRPTWRYYYRNEKGREGAILQEISYAKERMAYKAKKIEPCKFEVGHILETSWGYDQTNIDFYKVIEKRGQNTLIVQELEQVPFNTGNEPSMTGRSIPAETFRKNSKPFMIRAAGNSNVKIDGHFGSLWDGRPVSWTAYH